MRRLGGWLRMHGHYARYVAVHKFWVYVEGRRLRVPRLRLLRHDLSKLRPDEWVAYARSFYGPQPRTDEVKRRFDAAWLQHQRRNDHHWQAWVLREDSGATKVLPMPEVVARECLADWRGAGRALGQPDTAGWYRANCARILLHPDTRRLVERLLGLTHREES